MAIVEFVHADRPRQPSKAARLAVAALGFVTVVSGCAGADVPEVPAGDAELVEGRALYASNCVSCHGGDGRGGRGSKLNGGRLVERYPDPTEQLLIVSEGRRAMPSFGDKMSAEELQAVVRYSREIIAVQP